MKLIRAHIDNFGKLHDYDVEFHDGLNCIVNDNGWGKSTLAAFIKVMLFGFDNDRKQKIYENERKRYDPWQGGSYGGYLVFEKDGRRYRVERFVEKGNALSFRLYDDETNLPINDYSENLGEKLFGIDLESFSNSVYVGQQDCGMKVTSEMNAKIGNVSSDTDDMSKYGKATEAIKAEKNRLSATRSTGLLSQMQKDISKLEDKTGAKERLENDYKTVETNLKECSGEIDELNAQLKKCDEQLGAAGKVGTLLADKKEYERIKQERDSSEIKLKQRLSIYPKGVPTEEEISIALRHATEMLVKEKDATIVPLNEQEGKEYDDLKELFAKKGIPEKEKLEEIKQNIDAINEKRNSRTVGLMSESELNRHGELERKFSLGVPTIEMVTDVISDLNEEQRISQELENDKNTRIRLVDQLRGEAERNRESAIAKEKANFNKKKTIMKVIIGEGILLTLIGLVFYFYIHAAWFWAVTLLGLTIIGYCLYKNPKEIDYTALDYPGKHYESNPQLLEWNALISEKESTIIGIQRSREAFCEEFGFEAADAIDVGQLYQIKSEVEEFESLHARYKKQDVEGEKQLDELSAKVCRFFENYGVEANISNLNEALYRLRNRIANYSKYSKALTDYNSAKESYDAEKKPLKEFWDKYGLSAGPTMESITHLRDDVREIAGIQEKYASYSASVDRFEKEHDISEFEELSSVEEIDVDGVNAKKDELKGKLDSKQEKYQRFQKTEEELSEKLQGIADAEQELIEKREEKKRLSDRYEVLKKTGQYLETAKENYLKHYLAPMQTAFDKFFCLLSGQETNTFELDAEMNVSKRSEGQLRDINLLSEGYKDVVGLCRRMAMIEAMYSDEQPFLIFDDPFVNLDNDNLEHALAFLEKLAKQYQILYITCHTVRTV